MADARLNHRRHPLLAAGLALATLRLGAAGPGGAAVPDHLGRAATVRFALPPSTTPNYIFPLVPGADSSNVNIDEFQYLMYRPLYWFGNGGRPVVNYSLSLARRPIFSDHDRTVTIDLRSYRWSDGTPVTSRDVRFWMDLLIANRASWFAYVPGAFPDNVTRISYPSATQVVMTFNRSYNPDWLLYNELSQITPLPQQSWDREHRGGPVGNYDRTRRGAVAVFDYLNGQATTLATYDSNPLWQVVDGPWRVLPGSGFDPTTGYTVLVPNRRYSGPVHPTLARFVEVPSPPTRPSSTPSAPATSSTATCPPRTWPSGGTWPAAATGWSPGTTGGSASFASTSPTPRWAPCCASSTSARRCST